MRPASAPRSARGRGFVLACLLPTVAIPAQGTPHASLVALTAEASARPAPSAHDRSELVARVLRGVVHVQVDVDGDVTNFAIERASTGVLVDATHVLTWLGLVREAVASQDKRIQVVFGDPAARTRARIVASAEDLGLALLELEQTAPAETLPLPLATEEAPPPGEPVLVLARPDPKERVSYAGVVGRALGGTTLAGKPIAAEDLLLTDATIDARCHGAALVDTHGRLLGLCSAEHVRRPSGEPTLEELKASSFGIVLRAAALRRAFDRLRTGPAGAAVDPSREARAVAAVAPSVVSVWSGPGDLPKLGSDDPGAIRRRPQLGSGVVVSARGAVLTNAHVLGSAKTAQVTLRDGRRFPAKLVTRHTATNTALLALELPAGTTLVAARCGDGSDALLGESVLAVGNPLGSELTVSMGVLSARRSGERLLQADPNLGNQNGGGALVDLEGRLLGIVDGGLVDKIDAAFARMGDHAKTETNLSYCVDLRTLRAAFGKQLGELAGETESIQNAPALTEAERAARASAITRTVDRCAKAMLNVYVSRTSRQADEEANPFATVAKATIQGESLGSGVVVDASGLAITNWHVVDSATEPDGSMRKDHVVSVRLWDGSSVGARVLSISREDDLALLQLERSEGRSFVPVELGDSAALRLGEGVIAIGNPLGFANTITAGIVTAKEQGIRVRGRWAKLENLIETDAAINGGNSGGALLDLGGRLVGINSAGGSGFASQGYAIPVNHVRKQVLDLLLSPEKLRSPFLGLRVRDERGQVVVREVEPEGPAARAGIARGERVVSLNGVAITWSVGFAREVLAADPERPFTIVLEKDGRSREVRLTPLTAAAWAVLRQTGAEVQLVTFEASPDLVRDASLALHRRFVGDPKAEPERLPSSVVRVVRTRGGDLEEGDLLLGVEFREEGANAEASSLRRFTTLEEVQACFNDPKTGSYEGTRYAAWVFRAGRIEVVALRAKRLLW